MPIQTRQQRYFAFALDQVTALRDRQDLSGKTKDSYGGLCHSLPFLIRNDGLCQTVAWIEEKATPRTETELSKAYKELRNHIALLLGVGQGAGLLAHVQNAPLTTYMYDTRELLDAWVYFKRFASSVLGVEASVDLGDALQMEVLA